MLNARFSPFPLEKREKREGKRKKKEERKEEKVLKRVNPQGNPPPHALLTLYPRDTKTSPFTFPSLEGGAIGPSIPCYIRPDFVSEPAIARQPQIHSPNTPQNTYKFF
jgi:hypothetical protein